MQTPNGVLTPHKENQKCGGNDASKWMEPEVTQLNSPDLHSHICREACFLSLLD